MAAIAMGDVNAVYTLGCAHRRQLLSARALHERSLLIRGPPIPAHKDDWRRMYRRSFHPQRFCNFPTCILIHRPSNCSEPRLCMTSFRCTRMRRSRSVHSRELWGGRLDGVLGRLGFPLERRVSLMILLKGWAFSFAFRREVFASLDVSYTAATLLPPSRRCRLNGALLDELLLVTGLAPLLETNLRAEPFELHHAIDASLSGAGGCSASITREDWLTLYDLAKKKGEHVRLDWNGEEPPNNMHDVRAASAPLALKLKWITLFSFRFFAVKHINLLELESLISLLRHITRAGVRAKRLLALRNLRVVLGERLKRTVKLTENFLLRKLNVLVSRQ